MTETYDPDANAIAERINGILKQEFIRENINLEINIMKDLIKNSVKIYNDIRPYYSCQMKTLKVMHRRNSIKIKTY